MFLVGIGTVFVVLTVLLWAVRLTSRVLSPPEPRLSASLAAAGPSVAEAIGDDLESVALAAYALHLARRARVRAPGPVSRWVTAGRLRETAPFERQGSGERWLPTR
jgi:Na+-transporting methylmalonyl-CoA/oxaloacetate decarboxylase gamma subunit